MGYKVQVYIYDLTQGMARSLGPALLGRPLDGVWHTAIVVYGKEYFYGGSGDSGSGIQWCNPGGTVMGQPLKVEELGETQITEEVFQDYLRTQGGDRFRGDRYDLFRHNCNNFSHETAQFLVGRGIPQHIVDLPGEILATPMGQMLAPMLQQMAPSGTSIPFTNNPAAPGPAPPPPSSSAPSSQPAAVSGAKLPVKEFITFDQPLKIDGLSKKLEEFNTKQPDEMKLSDSEVKIVIGIAKGLVRLSDENFAILTKVAKWKKDETFPLLDILRFKCVRSIFDNAKQVEQVAAILQDHLGPDTSPVSGMLAVRALANLLQKPEWRHLAAGGDTVTAVLGRVPTEHANTEIAVATFLYNMSVVQLQERNLDTCILIASSLVLQVLPVLSQDEALYRSLVSLGNIVSSGQEEVTQFLLSLDARELVRGYTAAAREPRVKACAEQILRLLGPSDTGNSGAGLDLD